MYTIYIPLPANLNHQPASLSLYIYSAYTAIYWFYVEDSNSNTGDDDAVHVRITNWKPDSTTQSTSSAALGVSSLVGIGLLLVMAYLFKMQTDKIEPKYGKKHNSNSNGNNTPYHTNNSNNSNNPMLEVQMGQVQVHGEQQQGDTVIELPKDV